MSAWTRRPEGSTARPIRSPRSTARVDSDSRIPPATARCIIPGTATRTASSSRRARPSRPRDRSSSGGLHPKRVLALGESQSAFRLVTYIDALQPRSPGIFDGYFVYSRGGDAADLSQAPQATITTPTPTLHPDRPPRTGLPLRDRDGPARRSATSPPASHRRRRYASGRRPGPPTTTPTASCIRGPTPETVLPTPRRSSRCSTLPTIRFPASSTARRR